MLILQPETVIGWQRAGWRMFWRWKSRRRYGRPGKDPELIQLIRRMWTVNPTWGSPRIRDELAKLGLHASTATIRKYRPKSRRRPSARMADLSPKPRWRHCSHGFLCRPDRDLAPALRLDRDHARTAQSHSLQHHGSTDGRVDCPADRQCVPVRHSAQISVAGPGFDLRIGLRAPGGRPGYPAEIDLAAFALAKPLRGAADRIASGANAWIE